VLAVWSLTLPSWGEYERDLNILTELTFLGSLKTANPTRQEQARLEVENAEDDLVQKTEVAISMMKAVLENVGAMQATQLVCF
jgi:hypothetical protein